MGRFWVLEIELKKVEPGMVEVALSWAPGILISLRSMCGLYLTRMDIQSGFLE